MIVFSPPKSLSNQLHLGIVVLLRWQNKITEESLKITCLFLVPIIIMRTPKIWEPHTYPVQLSFFHHQYVYIFDKNKRPWRNSVYKDHKLPMNLNSSNWAQIKMKTGFEMLIFCCGNNIGTKHGLVKVRSAAQLLWTISISSMTQSRIPRFRRNSTGFRTGLKQTPEALLCCCCEQWRFNWAAAWANEQCGLVEPRLSGLNRDSSQLKVGLTSHWCQHSADDISNEPTTSAISR